MFVLRSAFWLVVGFLLVAPHGTDFGAAASEAGNQALAAGTHAAEQLIVGQVFASDPIAHAVVSQLSFSPSPSADLPMQDSTAAPVVFPRPRPAAMG